MREAQHLETAFVEGAGSLEQVKMHHQKYKGNITTHLFQGGTRSLQDLLGDRRRAIKREPDVPMVAVNLSDPEGLNPGEQGEGANPFEGEEENLDREVNPPAVLRLDPPLRAPWVEPYTPSLTPEPPRRLGERLSAGCAMRLLHIPIRWWTVILLLVLMGSGLVTLTVDRQGRSELQVKFKSKQTKSFFKKNAICRSNLLSTGAQARPRPRARARPRARPPPPPARRTRASRSSGTRWPTSRACSRSMRRRRRARPAAPPRLHRIALIFSAVW